MVNIQKEILNTVGIWLITPKSQPLINVCITVRSFSVAGTVRIFNFLKKNLTDEVSILLF